MDLDQLLARFETNRDEVDSWLESAEEQMGQVRLVAERGGDVAGFVRMIELRRDERL